MMNGNVRFFTKEAKKCALVFKTGFHFLYQDLLSKRKLFLIKMVGNMQFFE